MAKKSKDKEKKKEQTSSSTDWQTILKWAYIIGGLVAALAGAFSFQNEILTWVLVLIGVLVGLFYINTEDLTNFGVRYLLLGATYSVLSGVPAVGGFVTGFFGGFFAFLGPIALATLFMWFWKKHIAPMMQSN
ncbi:MAG: hypothetical protein JNK81_09885 [Anaerolineales bacterium]|nr:hypothetical protein [Anaerolineales bacterium]